MLKSSSASFTSDIRTMLWMFSTIIKLGFPFPSEDFKIRIGPIWEFDSRSQQLPCGVLGFQALHTNLDCLGRPRW